LIAPSLERPKSGRLHDPHRVADHDCPRRVDPRAFDGRLEDVGCRLALIGVAGAGDMADDAGADALGKRAG